jgi:hypothetical protein
VTCYADAVNRLSLTGATELSTGRVDPRVGSGRVEIVRNFDGLVRVKSGKFLTGDRVGYRVSKNGPVDNLKVLS